MKVHGGPYQPAGVPDLIGCVKGQFFAFEVKQPGEEPSIVQVRMMKRMRASGIVVGVVCTPEEAIDLVRAVVR